MEEAKSSIVKTISQKDIRHSLSFKSHSLSIYTYAPNGNMTHDSRKGTGYTYNVLNRLSEVRENGATKAQYTWLADGAKLRVRDAAGYGFDYLGSLTYTGSNTGVQLETAAFPGGVIRLVSGTTQEINCFLTDHLGSIRGVVNEDGTLLEQNDYYPFGAKHIRPDYHQNENRYAYNAKEEQTTGNLQFLDYGFRVYDPELIIWRSVDPLAESFGAYSPFLFAFNNPLLFVDPNGAAATNYVDEDNNVLLQTNDGSDAVVVVPEEFQAVFRYYAQNYEDWEYLLNNPEWNLSWFRLGFRLSERQFTEDELFAMSLYSSINSRNAAAAFFLQPTAANLMRAALLEAASQWMTPEKLVMGATIGIGGLSAVGVAKGGASKLPTQIHHFATNKSKTFTPQMSQIADEFGLSLNGAWNKQALPHLGRHPNAYHNFVLDGMQKARAGAGGSQAEFLNLFNQYVKQPVIQNPGLLRKSSW